jgi:hypothetical protein
MHLVYRVNHVPHVHTEVTGGAVLSVAPRRWYTGIATIGFSQAETRYLSVTLSRTPHHSTHHRQL